MSGIIFGNDSVAGVPQIRLTEYDLRSCRNVLNQMACDMRKTAGGTADDE